MLTRKIDTVALIVVLLAASFASGALWQSTKQVPPHISVATCGPTVIEPPRNIEDEIGSKAVTAYTFTQLLFTDPPGGGKQYLAGVSKTGMEAASQMMIRPSQTGFQQWLKNTAAAGRTLPRLELRDEIEFSADDPDTLFVRGRKAGQNDGKQEGVVLVKLEKDEPRDGDTPGREHPSRHEYNVSYFYFSELDDGTPTRTDGPLFR